MANIRIMIAILLCAVMLQAQGRRPHPATLALLKLDRAIPASTLTFLLCMLPR